MRDLEHGVYRDALCSRVWNLDHGVHRESLCSRVWNLDHGVQRQSLCSRVWNLEQGEHREQCVPECGTWSMAYTESHCCYVTIIYSRNPITVTTFCGYSFTIIRRHIISAKTFSPLQSSGWLSNNDDSLLSQSIPQWFPPEDLKNIPTHTAVITNAKS